MIRDKRYLAVSVLALSVFLVFLLSKYGSSGLSSHAEEQTATPSVASVQAGPQASIPSIPLDASGLSSDRSLEGAVSERTSPELPAFPIDLNTATVETLDLLPGVGAKTAERITQKRSELGGFTSVEQLSEVKYIGRQKLDKIRPFVIVRQHKR